MHYAKPLLLAFLASVLLAFSHSGQTKDESYYTWVDEDGVTNFSQRNPRHIDASYITRPQSFGIRNLPPQTGTGRGEMSGSKGDADGTPNQDEELAREEQAVHEEIARVRASNCSIGRRNLAKLQAYARIRVRDSDGTERVLTDEEKQQRTENAQQIIKENCGAG